MKLQWPRTLTARTGIYFAYGVLLVFLAPDRDTLNTLLYAPIIIPALAYAAVMACLLVYMLLNFPWDRRRR